MNRGEVVEEGSHDQLMASGGRYKTMFELQAARFDEGLGDLEELEESDDLDVVGSREETR